MTKTSPYQIIKKLVEFIDDTGAEQTSLQTDTFVGTPKQVEGRILARIRQLKPRTAGEITVNAVTC